MFLTVLTLIFWIMRSTPEKEREVEQLNSPVMEYKSSAKEPYISQIFFTSSLQVPYKSVLDAEKILLNL